MQRHRDLVSRGCPSRGRLESQVGWQSGRPTRPTQAGGHPFSACPRSRGGKLAV